VNPPMMTIDDGPARGVSAQSEAAEAVVGPEQPRFPLAWQHAGLITQQAFGKRLKWGGAFTVGALLAVLLFLSTRSLVFGVGAIACSILASACWVEIVRASRRDRREMRRAYECWQLDTGGEEVVSALARAVAYLATEQHRLGVPQDAYGRIERVADLLRANLETAHRERLDAIIAVVRNFERETDRDVKREEARAVQRYLERGKHEEFLRSDVVHLQDQLAEALRRLERDAASDKAKVGELLAAARRLEMTIGADMARVLQYAAPNPPSLPGARRLETARQEMNDATRRAEAGIVRDSPAVGAMMSERGRWSAYAASSGITRELMALFDRGDDSAVVPRSARPPDDSEAPRDDTETKPST